MTQTQQLTGSTRSTRSVIAYLSFLGMLMATGIDIALPAFDEIDADLGAGGRESLIVTLYVTGAAFGQLVVGPVSDRFGRRPIVAIGVVLYLAGAIASALAPGFGALLVARFIWGLGAAAPTGLRTAITRDLYSGDQMARIATIMMAVFLIGPVFTPLIGDALLGIGSWPLVFWFAAALAAIALLWTFLFGETLPEERRRPLEPRKFAEALGLIVRTRITVGHILANMFFSAAFFIFLGSAQPVFDRVFGRVEEFAELFAIIGLATIPLLLISNRLIARFGARRVSVCAAAVAVTLSVAGAAVVLTAGQPEFWPWYTWLLFTSAFVTVSSPPLAALALEPMGELAGTASSLLFFSGFAGGAGLAALFDARIDDTVTPFVLGFAVYLSIGFACQLWAGSPTTGEAGRS